MLLLLGMYRRLSLPLSRCLCLGRLSLRVAVGAGWGTRSRRTSLVACHQRPA
jgi:hypothetical protein